MADDIGELPASGLGKLLQDERFLVPTHQRDYSWSVGEVSLLLDDVEAAYDRRERQYFVGLMVLMGAEGPEKIVLDGQQRLATAVIYFSAVRNWLSQYSEHKLDASKIDEWFIGRSELGKKEAEPRIVLNSANHQIFVEYIIKAVPTDDIKTALGRLKRYGRNRKLLEAAIYCHDRIAELAKKLKPDEVAKRLFEIVLYLRDSVGVVRLNVRNDETAFTIFETLNDRGVELSPLDLVKNYLFQKASKHSVARQRDMEDRWVQMMSTLSNVKADAFLKAFWTSRFGRIQASNLYAQFKKEYDHADKAVAVSVEMLNVAEQYAALETSDDPVWTAYSKETRESVRSLKLLGARQTHPVILAALERFDAPEMERLMWLLETIIVRYQLIGGGRTGQLEIICASLAKAIYTGEITDQTGTTRKVLKASDVYREAQSIYPSDQTFEAEFSVVGESNSQKAVYILRAVERELRRRDTAVKSSETDLAALSLEHVLPKNPGAEWASTIIVDKSLREDCTNRLGNLCLLAASDNRAVGRMSFNDKKAEYAKSIIKLTSEIAQYPTWDRTAIERRQAAMAKIAISVWHFQ
jgi:hypothetical protein